jgi:hypothetical protein
MKLRIVSILSAVLIARKPKVLEKNDIFPLFTYLSKFNNISMEMY